MFLFHGIKCFLWEIERLPRIIHLAGNRLCLLEWCSCILIESLTEGQSKHSAPASFLNLMGTLVSFTRNFSDWYEYPPPTPHILDYRRQKFSISLSSESGDYSTWVKPILYTKPKAVKWVDAKIYGKSKISVLYLISFVWPWTIWGARRVISVK